MTPEQIAALAAACERAADYANALVNAGWVNVYYTSGVATADDAVALVTAAEEDAEALRAHARALRDGRWKRNEETT